MVFSLTKIEGLEELLETDDIGAEGGGFVDAIDGALEVGFGVFLAFLLDEADLDGVGLWMGHGARLGLLGGLGGGLLLAGEDGDAEELDGFEGLAGFAGGAYADGGLLDFAEGFFAVEHFAEGGVFAVEVGCWSEHEEKLAAGGVGVGGASHGDDAAGVVAVVEFAADGVTWAAGAP